jgi:uncharacterized protein with ParB-like and HNH nuclease domain
MNDKNLEYILNGCSEEPEAGKEIKLFIPDIQRDYVMGSNTEMIKGIIEEIITCCQNSENFHFYTLILYKNSDEKNVNISIYDGQQRITTLIILLLYLTDDKRERENLTYKFSFIELFN